MADVDGISNFELADLAKKHKVDLKLEHIIMADQLQNIPLKRKMNLIINLQKSSQGGSHWVCLVIRGKNSFYCDSFGMDCDVNVLQYCRKSGIHLACNKYVIQDLKSVQCGLYCFGLIKYIDTEIIPSQYPREFQNKLLELSNNYINLYKPNRKQNDKIVYKYLGI